MASGINNSGVVVGGSGEFLYFSDQATMWDRRGHPIELPRAGDYGEALATNEDEEVVGCQAANGEQRHACARRGVGQQPADEGDVVLAVGSCGNRTGHKDICPNKLISYS